LKRVRLERTDVTEAGVESFRKSRPDCKIEYFKR
jgi:hypothetical protein